MHGRNRKAALLLFPLYCAPIGSRQNYGPFGVSTFEWRSKEHVPDIIGRISNSVLC